jgi:hypothetical protein
VQVAEVLHLTYKQAAAAARVVLVAFHQAQQAVLAVQHKPTVTQVALLVIQVAAVAAVTVLAVQAAQMLETVQQLERLRRQPLIVVAVVVVTARTLTLQVTAVQDK